MEKRFEHNEVEVCKVCKKDIEMTRDRWTTMIDYNANDQEGIGFYHTECLKEIIKGNMKIVEDKWKSHGRRMLKGIMGNLRGVEIEKNGI